MDSRIKISILIFSLLAILISGGLCTVHEKQFRSHSLFPISNVNCEIIKFRTTSDVCRRTNTKFPVRGSCTKFIYCYVDASGEFVAKEEECSPGTAFNSQSSSCGFSLSTTSCVQTECAEKYQRSYPSKNNQYPQSIAGNQRPQQPVLCDPEEDENEEELEFGKVPRICTPRATTERPPNWDRKTTRSPANQNQFPSNMNYDFNYPQFANPQNPSPGNRGQDQSPGSSYGSRGPGQQSVYGNREAGRDQVPQPGNRDQGREQGGTSFGGAGNRYGQGQGGWQDQGRDSTTEYHPNRPTSRNPYTYGPAQNGNSGGFGEFHGNDRGKDEYPPFPGQEYSTKPVATTKKSTFQEDSLQKGQGPYQGNPDLDKGQESDFNSEEEFQFEQPTHQSQHGNGKKLDYIVTVLLVLPSALLILNF